MKWLGLFRKKQILKEGPKNSEAFKLYKELCSERFTIYPFETCTVLEASFFVRPTDKVCI